MKKRKRTKNERTEILSLKKKEVELSLKKTNKEIQRLKTRISKRSLDGLSTKFLEKILSQKNKAARSIRSKLKSISQELTILRKSP